MTARVRLAGQGPFGPWSSFVAEVDGVKQVPAATLRFLCTTAKDAAAEGAEGTPLLRAAADRRVAKRMAAWGKGARFAVVP